MIRLFAVIAIIIGIFSSYNLLYGKEIKISPEIRALQYNFEQYVKLDIESKSSVNKYIYDAQKEEYLIKMRKIADTIPEEEIPEVMLTIINQL